MKKIEQGKYEIFTTKEDAIDKFMQIQGICRENISGENTINFNCYRNGKITITNPPRRRTPNNSTNLYAEIIEEDGKTYVAYYTEYSKSNSVFKLIYYVMLILIAVFGIIFAVICQKIDSLIILVSGVVLGVIEISYSTKEEKNSPKDSKILIEELEKRVEAVNQWDK